MNVSTAILPARARSRADTRARLLSSARELFAERGFHNVTSHDIARGASVAAGTFYLHFKDKTAALHELVQEALADLRGRLIDARERQHDIDSSLRAGAEALVTFAEEHRELVKIVFGHDQGTSDLESDVLDHLAAFAGEMLQSRLESGTLEASLHVGAVAQAITGMYARVIAWWIENPTAVSREALIDTLVEIQLHGTLSSGERGRQP